MGLVLLVVLGWIGASVVVTAVVAAVLAGAKKPQRSAPDARVLPLLPAGSVPGQRAPQRVPQRV
jgi:hypothetical protein